MEIGSMVSLRNYENMPCTEDVDSLALVMVFPQPWPVTALMIVILKHDHELEYIYKTIKCQILDWMFSLNFKYQKNLLDWLVAKSRYYMRKKKEKRKIREVIISESINGTDVQIPAHLNIISTVLKITKDTPVI